MNALTRDLVNLVNTAEENQTAKEQTSGTQFREKLHLMPPVGWLNDPNGLCQMDGVFHAFFQYSPFNAEGGVKMWGHYTSTNLIDWEYKGVSLYPDQPFDCHGVYSGSAFLEDGTMYLYYTGNVKLEMTTLDIVEMIWQTNGEFEEKFATRSLELVSTLPESSMLIEADGRHLWRVLENVYNNAFKYAMEHTRVYTDLELKDDKIYVTIKNISANPLNVQGDELTERFVRGDVSRTTEGSGLGLSIAQSLTKLQGGTFEILIDGDLFKVRVGFGIKKPDQTA